MSNAYESSLGSSESLPTQAVVEVSRRAVSGTGCQCAASELVPLSKLNPKDPVLRSYLAPPTEPTANIVSPARGAGRREAAGIGGATTIFTLILCLIGMGTTVWSLVIPVALGLLTRVLVWRARLPVVIKDEQTLTKRAEAQLEVYRVRRATWDRLNYCPKCRYLVDGLTGECRPLHAAHELLVLSPTASDANHSPA